MQTELSTKKKAGVRAYFRDVAENQRKRHDKYMLYHTALAPKNPIQYLRRLQFAVCSAFQGWQANVKMMEAIKQMPPDFTEKQLEDAFKKAGTGLYTRAKSLHKLTVDFRQNPLSYMPRPGEDWDSFRNRLANKRVGMGLAKASFALEMLFPEHCRVVCLDRWILADYGIKTTDLGWDYREKEGHWVKGADDYELSPTMTRHMRWDDFHGKTNTRYWSYVLEDKGSAKVGRALWPNEDIACQPTCDSVEQEEWDEAPAVSGEAEVKEEARQQQKLKRLTEHHASLERQQWAGSGETCVPS